MYPWKTYRCERWKRAPRARSLFHIFSCVPFWGHHGTSFAVSPHCVKTIYLKRLRTFSSNFACRQASNVLTREEMTLPSAHSILTQHGCAVRWQRSRPAVAQRNGFRPSPLSAFDSSSLCLLVSLTLWLLVSLTLWLLVSFSLLLVCIMFLLYFCNWLECVTAFWRNRWQTRIRSFPVATWENAMSYHRKHTAPCCCSPKASSIVSTKQTLTTHAQAFASSAHRAAIRQKRFKKEVLCLSIV